MKTITYVALLRGINVGGAKKVAMKDLKTCFEDLELTQVRTYINSGNVVFQSGRSDVLALTKDIEQCLQKRFRFEVRVLLKTQKEFASIVNKIPKTWKNDIEMRTDIIFLWKEFDSKKAVSEVVINPDVDTLVYIRGAAVWHFDRKNYTKSKMHKFIGTSLYKNMTARNVNTVRRLFAMMEEM